MLGRQLVEPLQAYFELIWIGKLKDDGTWKDPRYPIRTWNAFELSSLLLPRSNNSLEGFHNGFRKAVAEDHPKVYFSIHDHDCYL